MGECQAIAEMGCQRSKAGKRKLEVAKTLRTQQCSRSRWSIDECHGCPAHQRHLPRKSDLGIQRALPQGRPQNCIAKALSGLPFLYHYLKTACRNAHQEADPGNSGKIIHHHSGTGEVRVNTHSKVRDALVRNGPNTVSGSTVSNTELSEFFGAH